VPIPATPSDWHPIAKRWFNALKKSGQKEFYEPSDWATAFLIAESISRDLNPQFIGFVTVGHDETKAEYAEIPLKGASLGAYLKAMACLLATEGDRRRASLELTREQPADADEDAAVIALDTYRAQLGA
jgi:hypothetical protein